MSIPLTFDWLTLAWLELRLSLWWRSRRVARVRSSLRQLATVVALGVVAGCVPVTRFEETQSAAQVEMAGRLRAEQRISQLEAEIQELAGRLRQRDVALEQRGDDLAQAELDKSTQGKERADAEGMVEQLRGELARVGGHLQAFHAEKQSLQATLQAEAARGPALARLSRDLTLALTEPIATGEVELDAQQGHVELRVTREKLLADDGSLKAEAASLQQAVARVLKLHPGSKLRVEDGAAPADPVAAARIASALGVSPERIESLPAAVDGSAPPTWHGVTLGFSVP